MNKNTSIYKIEAQFSKNEYYIDLKELKRKAMNFLEYFATEALTDSSFVGIIGAGNGEERFQQLMKACHFSDADIFLKEILSSVMNGGKAPVNLKEIQLPTRFLVALLEVVITEKGYISIKTVDQLIKETNLFVPEEQKEDLQKVIEKYPVRLSYHTIRQMMVSDNVAYQYMPFIEELDTVGHTNTWIGQFHEGLLEQMYQNRVIFLLNMSCPVYCRFCFRKHKESRNETNPTILEIKKAISHVESSPGIKEIVITGGDPFLSKNSILAAIDGLMQVPHVQTLRLATRSVAYYPNLFLKNERSYLKFLKQKNLELQQNGKRMEIATHFIHPDEVSPESLEIISELVNSGISVYVQTPFLQDCNDQGPELQKLFLLLRGAGAEMHYIYIPCSPIHGNSVYWSPLSNGIDIAEYLRAYLSDRSVPKICTATPIGKMEWYTSGWAVEPVKDKENLLWIRTPYTPEYFKSFAPLAKDLPNIRVNSEGTLDIQYMAKIGKESYFMGSRPLKISKTQLPIDLPEELSIIKSRSRLHGESIINTGSGLLKRVHRTRVELSTEATQKELDYIADKKSISDVVLIPRGTITDELNAIERIASTLLSIPHVNALRLRSLCFNYAPERFQDSHINRLGELNRLTVANPLRVEIESWFMHPDEIKVTHKKLTRQFNNKGISVYCNTALYGEVNDYPDLIQELTFNYRQAGMEFHHLYVAGHPVQREWNKTHPVDMYDIIDIASKIRREGSGREGPRYIIQTPLGEVYYGLTSSFSYEGEKVIMKLDSYDQDYYQELDADFSLPEGIIFDEDNKPVMSVPGLINTTGFRV
ncbi:radical SAM protein [Oceanispirochaeta sp.]|jgi:lysine 2,3-aminomutase|uniref:radical SAM protein n=1 Tax=Oceanispirochaeta sp. TaxID=2035350 RepID=UPI0026200041|nr:radical SAM protein [Oceanispirochaeta sp.]MDA3956742.1 radical SAM protein [Oceanispirochaeta sp.]